MPYMSVVEVESALAGLSSAHPTLCELITLPNQTLEGRTTHAVRIGTQPASAVDIFYLTGGVHAREWGSCEILVNLATDLCDAYAGNTGIAYGGKHYSARQVKVIMERMNIIVYPCVNPDGRNFSQTGEPLWRKNRNTASSGGSPDKIGVDINRNQDFLWDFNTAFNPGAMGVFLASADPFDDTFHGTAPHSERETQNINWIHDNFPRIKWYIDVHSFSEDILYVWGHDEVQVSEPSKNFTNSAYNGQRGLAGDSYKEYIDDGDELQIISLAQAFTRALGEVRGKYYVAKPGFSLYATSGTNDDYAYSRHIANSSNAKALSYTVEWGQEFQPPWDEMERIILDVCSGFLGFASQALGISSYIVTDRDTFSIYELESTNDFPASFYVIYDGFSPASFGLPGTMPTFSFIDTTTNATINGISASVTSVALEDAGAPNTAQRISFTCSVHIDNNSIFTVETRDIAVLASLDGAQDRANIRLIKQPNPYIVDGPISWLSTDVRVFQLRPGQKVDMTSNVTMGDPNTNSNAPFSYIQSLLTELRGYGNNPALPFEHISQDESESHLELSRSVDGTRVLNFAVAKVRYRANTQDATDVRVFFRTFNTMVSDLTYTSDTGAQMQNYRRKSDGTIPLLGLNKFFSGAGSQVVSIPYFAEPRVNSATTAMTSQSDNWNKHNINHTVGQESVMYFGCWLDFNQTEPQFPPTASNDGPFGSRQSIMQLVRGIHQCLVAEVRFQPGATDPIANGATPGSSDRLAQRNLAIVESDNPGDPSTHVVQHTLLIKPSILDSKLGRLEAERIGGRNFYDELVIRWNGLPRDTVATFYFPACDADALIALDTGLRGRPSTLSRVDDHTISCPVQDTSYIPIPSAATQPYAGLLTLQLPQGVRTGQRYTIDVAQHSGPVVLRVSQTQTPTTGHELALTAAIPAVSHSYTLSRRRQLGAFRLKVLVKDGPNMLGLAVRNLAVLKYISEGIASTDIWHPVFVRYVQQLGDKVKGLGVDPEDVPASPDDPGIPSATSGGRNQCYTGKITEVHYNCHGDFEGFMLDICCDIHKAIRADGCGIGKLALMACKECLTVTVCINKKGKVCSFVIRNSAG